VNLQRYDARSVSLLGTCSLMALLFVGCATPKVGAPCLPEQVPETGFAESESYVESSSVQCETRVCLVFHLAGDPRDTCNKNAPPAQTCDPKVDENCVPIPVVKCADPKDVADRVYCTCRCDSKGSGFGECECPTGYGCVDVLEQGGPGVRGGYCVKTGT
jgi:hypothetical protein